VYVFDTDILSLLMKGRLAEGARKQVAAVPSDQAYTTTVTLGELCYGALRSSATTRWLAAVEQLAGGIRFLSFDENAARRYGELRVYLERRGKRLDDADLRIAAICSAQGAILISGNAKHFSRVPNLRFEDWLRSSP
jgi:tRNA(fMet)-specific endonuclease VapC